MLYYLAQYLEEISWMRLFDFITFRAGLAVIFSLLISMVFGGNIIRWLQKQQIGETVRDLGLEGQLAKQGTPTMGGVIIIMAIIIPCLLVAKLHNIYIILMLLATLWMGIIGFIDDYIKVFKKDKAGLSGKFKILGQIVLGIIIGCTMLMNDDIVVQMDHKVAIDNGYEVISVFESEEKAGKIARVKTTLTNVPFFKNREFDYSKVLGFLGDNAGSFVWIVFIPFVIIVVSAVSNAANLTDGLDGLATGVCAIIGAVLGILAYVSGNIIAADYLEILYLPGTGELVVFMACFLGACIGFLWYNSFPAQIFMGDTGSLTLGGIIAAIAILIRKELLIPVLCGVLLMETLSVMIQVSYFKYTKRKYGEGQRVFLMSPLHHHYQKQGMPEAKIVTRFWIVTILLAVLTLITLKVR